MDVPLGLGEGFQIGSAGLVKNMYIPKNHASALEQPEVILDLASVIACQSSDYMSVLANKGVFYLQ